MHFPRVSSCVTVACQRSARWRRAGKRSLCRQFSPCAHAARSPFSAPALCVCPGCLPPTTTRTHRQTPYRPPPACPSLPWNRLLTRLAIRARRQSSRADAELGGEMRPQHQDRRHAGPSAAWCHPHRPPVGAGSSAQRRQGALSSRRPCAQLLRGLTPPPRPVLLPLFRCATCPLRHLSAVPPFRCDAFLLPFPPRDFRSGTLIFTASPHTQSGSCLNSRRLSSPARPPRPAGPPKR